MGRYLQQHLGQPLCLAGRQFVAQEDKEQGWHHKLVPGKATQSPMLRCTLHSV